MGIIRLNVYKRGPLFTTVVDIGLSVNTFTGPIMIKQLQGKSGAEKLYADFPKADYARGACPIGFFGEMRAP